MIAATMLERDTTFVLEPLGEFSLRAAAMFWGGFTPASHAGLDAEGHVHMAFAVEGSWATAGVCVREVDGHIEGRVYGDVDTKVVGGQTARILSLDVDGRAFARIGLRDSVAGQVQHRYPGLRPVCFYSPYEAAVWAIVSHRIRMQQAAAIKTRLSEAFGDVVNIHGQPMRAFPGPRALSSLQDFPGLFGNKIANLRAVAQAALAGDLDFAYLRSLPDAEALARLRSLPGIGPFSSELILVRGAGHPDYLTFEEPKFRRAVAQAYQLDHTPTDDELRRISANWRPYRMWMTFLLRQELERADPNQARSSDRSSSS
jgi:DNA-3-methyladenine glycosylase II